MCEVIIIAPEYPAFFDSSRCERTLHPFAQKYAVLEHGYPMFLPRGSVPVCLRRLIRNVIHTGRQGHLQLPRKQAIISRRTYSNIWQVSHLSGGVLQDAASDR